MSFFLSLRNRSIIVTSITLALLSVILAYYSLGMNVVGHEIPLTYTGDGLFISALIKGLVDNSWIFENDFLGFPYGSNLYGFPTSDCGNFIILKILSFFTQKYYLILNAFVLISFSVNALTSYWFFIKQSISMPVSFLGALLFSFLPFHFLRIEHTFLMMYFTIPVFFHFALRIFDHKPVFFDNTKFARKLLSGICLLCISSFGVYFSFFGLLVFIISGLLGFYNHKEKANLYSAFVCVLLISFGVLLNIAPNLYQSLTRSDIPITLRAEYDTETFGLKFSQMLLPRANHRLESFSRFDKTYNSAFLINNDAEKANLGLIGAFGFLIIIASWFISFKIEIVEKDFWLISKISLFLILFCTVGGFGSVFSIMVSPQIRAGNRASIFLGFTSLYAVLIFIEGSFKNVRQKLLICFGLFLLGLWDQTGVVDKLKFLQIKSSFISDEKFVKLIEYKYPQIGIYQLPKATFPEAPNMFLMTDYEHFKGYLHSSSLKWSYACFRGTECDVGFSVLSAKPIIKQIREIQKLGFRGIYINRSGYADGAFKLENELKSLLGDKSMLISPDASKSFFYLNGKIESN